MKCKFDFCRVQWLNRELIPVESRYTWSKNESRFVPIFQNLLQSSEIQTTQTNQITSSENTRTKSNDIDILKILTQEDKRTTLMIRNIPNKFTLDQFLNIFNKNFEGKFNLFLLPTDIRKKKNYGYAFINFINNYYIVNFYYSFNGKKWENTNSVKICNIVYSKIQDISKMIKHYPNKVMYLKDLETIDNEENEKYDSSNIQLHFVNLPKVDIPLIYEEIFHKIFPHISTKDKKGNNDNDFTFNVDINTLFMFSPNLKFE